MDVTTVKLRLAFRIAKRDYLFGRLNHGGTHHYVDTVRCPHSSTVKRMIYILVSLLHTAIIGSIAAYHTRA
jgi:hypothetical protein